jgi:hypothetical protein
MALDEKIIEEAKAKHGHIHTVPVPFPEEEEPRVFLFRKPRKPEYKRYRQRLYDEDTREGALEELVRSVIVHPPKEEFNALLEEFPALADSIGKEVTRVCCLVKVEEGKRY